MLNNDCSAAGADEAGARVDCPAIKAVTLAGNTVQRVLLLSSSNPSAVGNPASESGLGSPGPHGPRVGDRTFFRSASHPGKALSKKVPVSPWDPWGRWLVVVNVVGQVGRERAAYGNLFGAGCGSHYILWVKRTPTPAGRDGPRRASPAHSQDQIAKAGPNGRVGRSSGPGVRSADRRK